jgi:hypothetical protein
MIDTEVRGLKAQSIRAREKKELADQGVDAPHRE